MHQFQQIVLRPAAAPRPGGPLSASELRRCRQRTLDLLRRGWRIPVLPAHAPSGAAAGGPCPAAGQQPGGPAGSRPIGWLVDLVELPDGALAQTIQIDDERAAAAIAAGRMPFTSPELRPSVLLADRQHAGPLIAHIALTERPLCPGQTPLAPLPQSQNSGSPFPPGDQVMSTTHERFGPAMIDGPPPDETQADVQPGDEASPAPPAPMPQPPERQQPETDQAGDGGQGGEGAVDSASGAAASTNSAAAQRAAAASANPAADLLARRSLLVERIRHSRVLPKGLKDRFAQRVQTVQLSGDADPVPVIPVAEAVELIEAALPEHLQLAPEQLHTAAHPRGEGFFTGGPRELSDEEAQRIAAEQLAASGFGPAA